MMNPKTKNILINGMIGLAFVLLIISFVVGKNEDSEIKEKEEVQQQQEDEDFSFTSPSSQGNTTKETESENTGDLQKIKPNKDLVSVIGDGTEGEKAEINKLSDFFSQEDIEASKEVAKQFSQNYYQFHGDNPLSHVENAKKYMTTDLYGQLSKEIPRPTLTTFKKEIQDIELYEPYNVSSKELEWMSRINGTVYNYEGKKTKEEVLEYRLTMTKESEGFKVKNATITLTN
jgi:hypothetical protein